MNGYPDFIHTFLEIKNPHELPAGYDFVAAAGLTAADVPHLTRLATDAGFLFGDEAALPPEYDWLPVFAWRSLAQLGARGALDALWSLFYLPRTDMVNTHLPAALLGFECADVLESLGRGDAIADWSDNGFLLLAEILTSFAARTDANRRAIVAFLRDLLDGRAGRAAHYNGYVGLILCRLGAVETFPAIFDAMIGDAIDLGVLSPEEFLIHLKKAAAAGGAEFADEIDELTERFALAEIDAAELDPEFLRFEDFWAGSPIHRSALRYLLETLGAHDFARLAASVNRLQRVPFLYCFSENLFGRLKLISKFDAATDAFAAEPDEPPPAAARFGEFLSDEEKRALQYFTRHLRILLDKSAEPEEDFYFLFAISYSLMIDEQAAFPAPSGELKRPGRVVGVMRRLVEVSHDEAHVMLENMEDESNKTGRIDLSAMMSYLSHDICRILGHSKFADDDDFFDNNTIIDDPDGPLPFDRVPDPKKPRKC